jgi:hypothetical protein
MPAFGDRLSATQIDDVTAFLRSRSTGWKADARELRKPPPLGQYVLNPRGKPPTFGDLKDGRYVSAAVLDVVAVAEFGIHFIKVYAVGKLVAEFIAAVPCIVCDVSADVNVAKLIPHDLAHHFSAHRHDAYFHVVRNLVACENKHKFGGCGERIRIVEHFCNGRFIDDFKSDAVIKCSAFIF